VNGEGRPIRIVLDTSAILACTRGSIDVGEPLAEIADDGGAAGLPALCLAEARWMVDDPHHLGVLVEHQATTLVPAPEDWRALAATNDIVGRLDAASAVLSALDEGCCVLSARPGSYGGLAGGGPIIEA
jgi:hypothetical protein